MSTTTYLCEYDDLLRGTKGYCLRGWLSSLEDLSFDDAINKLKDNIDLLLVDIKNKTIGGFEIEKFTIGKSFVRQRHTAGNRYMTFVDKDPNTWKLADGVNARWRNTYAREDYDGLVVLCVTPRNIIPDNAMHVGPQLYAIALEQRLIQEYCFSKNDRRLGNVSFDTGSKAEEPYAGLVYLAYKLKEIYSCFD
ncbi:Hypothetical predicted protein [Mytilus galloprovincialis]|uniref:Uncharacterized protein n=1 Tax=Mytilus galloprovincialis TaxID=29158 RepID=A0A8B6E5Q3_MYTGA|nr:Hypothetical predicted protein [Mytilus galloprovincialis]